MRTFSASQPRQPVYGRGPDKAWVYVDKEGHAHSYADGYPTLVERSVHVPCDDPECFSGGYCDGYEATWYECSLCGERIRPTSVDAVYYIAGRAEYWIDGEPVTVEEFNEQLAVAMNRDIENGG